MTGSLDASNFNGAVVFFAAEFESVLHKVTQCYVLMIEDGIRLPRDENLIRDCLVNGYLNNSKIKRQLELRYFVNPEVPEPNNKRPDIKFQSVNHVYEPEIYFSIECKVIGKDNVHGKTGLNAKYIKNGICRYVSGRYSSFGRVNGMIGFVIDEMDIHENIRDINKLLTQSFSEANATSEISAANFISGFEYHYVSKHLDNRQTLLTIYHLMFDFHKNIVQ
ncbi:hypothetical protein ACFLR1_03860 [Bacteroidota bacterium]